MTRPAPGRTLGHLDLIKRYDQAGPWPDENARSIVAEILEDAIRRGKGIELNTSSIRYGLADLTPSTELLRLYRDLGGRILDLTPSTELLRLYRDLGGRILTSGSDSHKPEHLGAHSPMMRERLKDIGFTEFCTFQGMEPMFHKL